MEHSFGEGGLTKKCMKDGANWKILSHFVEPKWKQYTYKHETKDIKPSASTLKDSKWIRRKIHFTIIWIIQKTYLTKALSVFNLHCKNYLVSVHMKPKLKTFYLFLEHVEFETPSFHYGLQEHSAIKPCETLSPLP